MTSDTQRTEPSSSGSTGGIRAEADRIVEEEVLRARVRALVMQPQPDPWWERLSKNPLLQLVVGFLLTGLVGAVLTNHWNEEQRQSELRRADRESSLRAVERLSQLLNGRRTASAMLNSALKQNWPLADLRMRKSIYDSIYVQWNNDILVSELTIRRISGAKDFSPIEAYLDEALAPRLSRIDSVLTAAYTARLLSKNDTSMSRKLASLQPEFAITRECVYAITNALWIAANTATPSDTEWVRIRKTNDQLLQKNCPKTSSASPVGADTSSPSQTR